MKNKKATLVTLMLLLFTLSISATATFEITPDINTLVPENSLIYFQISNPDKFAQSMDRFLESTGLNQSIGNMAILDFLGMTMESDNSRMSLDYIDLTKPVGFAMFPKETNVNDEKDMDFMMFLPVNKNKDILDIVSEKPEGGDYWYKLYMNYIVFFSAETIKSNFPPEDIKDLSGINSYESDSFTIYMDMNGFIQYLYPDSSKMSHGSGLQDSGESDFSANLIEGYFAMLGEIKAIISNITLNRQGITLENNLIFKDALESQIVDFKSPSGIKKWSPFLPEKGIFQSIFTLDSENRNFLMKTITDYLLSADEGNPVVSELKQSMETFSRFRGNGGIFSINLSPPGSKSSELPFRFDISMVTDITDTDGFIRELTNYYSSRTFTDMMNKLDPEKDYSIGSSIEEQESKGPGRIFRIKYHLEERKTKSDDRSADRSEDFPWQMEFWYYFADNKVYSYFGSGGFEGLENLINGSSTEKKWVSSAPGESSMIWEFSPGDLLKVLSSFPGLDEFISADGAPFNMSGFAGFSNGSLNSTTQISTENIINLLQLLPGKGQ